MSRRDSPGTRSVPSPRRSPEGDHVRHRASHRHLLQDFSGQEAPQESPRTRLDALVVPAARPAQVLEHAIRLASSTGTHLLVLCSRQARVGEVATHLAGEPGLRAFVVDIPPGYAPEAFGAPHLPTLRQETAEQVSPGRDSDLSLKRNLGLVLARLLGWRKIMFLDDDIRGLRPDDLRRLAVHLDRSHEAGLRSTEFPDNSVACHANRLSGQPQDVFATGAALGVNCLDRPLPFFPNIYNEDWFSFCDLAAARALPIVGTARQKEYDPYADPRRAAHEEFGDLLAEGLFSLIDDGGTLTGAGEDYWESFCAVRDHFLTDTSRRLEARGDALAYRALRSLDAARKELARITPSQCVRYISDWDRDRRTWQDWSRTLPLGITPEQAFDRVGLPDWRATEFANPDVPLRLVRPSISRISRNRRDLCTTTAVPTETRRGTATSPR